MEMPTQAFPTGITVLVAAVPPGCAADGACHGVITCLSPLPPALAIEGLGDGEQHPLPTRAVLCGCPVLGHLCKRRDAPAHLQVHSLGSWATPAPILRGTGSPRS